MGRSSRDSALPPPLTARDFDQWDRDHGRCCTASNFRIDITGFVMSDWNKSAAQVFAKAFLQQHNGCGKSRNEVAKAWLNHVETLKTQYILKSNQEVRSMEMHERRRGRKGTLYSRRLQTAYMYPQIANSAATIVKQLGVDGMSSDESDLEALGPGTSKTQVTYSIVQKQWRASAVTNWLRTLDSLHIRLRYKGEWKVSAGAWPHFRNPSLKTSSKPVVVELPLDFYASKWLNSITNFQRKNMGLRKPTGDLAIPPFVSEYAQSHLLLRDIC
ncbi:hypothetical protein BJ138DRAFT_1020430 [Hygrophoropsis aurantiaca]|uniref:Uncharacterized protein n=1 Tax=Hygrophoropsis aurantiaca TaxID=72124 RepID=A0ACB7ZR45_9AGAM|nr:hypothetical protein BJ138DRAFT_1020430 [Hygrophoropsis aurantiaca]